MTPYIYIYFQPMMRVEVAIPANGQVYHPILPLRLLLLKREDEAKSRLAEMFMDHREDRMK